MRRIVDRQQCRWGFPGEEPHYLKLRQGLDIGIELGCKDGMSSVMVKLESRMPYQSVAGEGMLPETCCLT